MWFERRRQRRTVAPKDWRRTIERVTGIAVADLQPIRVEGRRIAKSVWGAAWCEHLERYSDYSNRLPRGRTYLRNGAVLHVGIERGLVAGAVLGSAVYGQRIEIEPLDRARSARLAARCTQAIGDAVDLIAGRLPSPVLAELTDPSSGLFPQPSEIRASCSCPDWAYLCKHLAAVLYGIGARLDGDPQLLFRLRGLDPEALAGGIRRMFVSSPPPPERRLEGDLAKLFDIEMIPEAPPDEPLVITREELAIVGVKARKLSRLVAKGHLIALGGDRYEITPEGWDLLEPMFEVDA
jgi:uncharacterized Zn finger protein